MCADFCLYLCTYYVNILSSASPMHDSSIFLKLYGNSCMELMKTLFVQQFRENNEKGVLGLRELQQLLFQWFGKNIIKTPSI